MADLTYFLQSQSTAVVAGPSQLWRIDPTGQCWDCRATVAGRDAERMEAAFYRQVCKYREENEAEDAATKGLEVGEYLHSLESDVVLSLACECLQSCLWPANALTLSTAASPIHWQAIVLESSDAKAAARSRTRLHRGAFLPPRRGDDTK